MALWGSKKPTTHTNAPRTWPKIELDQFDNLAVNALLIGAELATTVEPPKSSIAFLQDFLYEDGILRVPIVFEEAGQKTCVFVYNRRDGNAAAHYSGVRALLRSRENANAVYYAPEALNPVKPSVVLQSIDTQFFSKDDKASDDAAFALWWATDDAPKLAGSDEVSLLDRWFEALDGYGYVLLTVFLRGLEMVEGEKTLYGLPSQALLQPVVGPGDTRMLLHASEAEGLFFAFEESTAPSRRRLLLRLLADFATDFRKALESRKVPAQDDEKGRGLERWRAIRDAALAKEASGEAGLKLHAVSVKAGQPSRSPNATTAADRAAQPQTPGREELDFGMDVVDAIVARLKSRKVAASTQSDLGAPNFAPVIAVKVGTDVFERQVPMENLPEVQAAAGRVLDEWPEAEIVAVIGDGAVRENGKRVDIFDVKVENRREGRAAALIQRYRAGRGGALELIGRPSATAAERFVLEATSPREPAPDEGLVAVARQALDEIVAATTVIEPSGMCGDDPEEALFSPSAFINLTGEPRPHIYRFMMQGPITAALSCQASLQKKPADWVAFHMDDLVSRNGSPERRLRLCVQRRQDPAMAVFDQAYEAPRKGQPFTRRGDLVFKRWGGSMFPPPA